MKKITFVLIVFICMFTYSKAQTNYSDTVKNVFGINILPLLPILPIVFDFKSDAFKGDFAIDFRLKHNFSKGALRIGAFAGIKDDGRYNDENIITSGDSMYTFHTITGSANYFGLRLGYERSRQIRPKWRFNFGADMTGSMCKIDMYDNHYTMRKITNIKWEKSEILGSDLVGTHSFVRIGFSPFISYDYILSKKLSLTAQLNYDYISEHSIDASYASSGMSGSPSFNLMLNYQFSKR
jgi:hypothetical protein